MVSNIDSLTGEIRRAVAGDPWFGPSAATLLANMDATTAALRPESASHSVWEIVRHMTSWARYVAGRVGGAPAGEPAEGDWPVVTATDAASWAEAVADLHRSHDELCEQLGKVLEESLDEVRPETPSDDNGEPVTLRRAVEGVAQHDAYHCGQIAVLKRLLPRVEPAPA